MSAADAAAAELFTRQGDGPIRQHGRVVLEGTPTHAAVAVMLENAETMALVTGSTGAIVQETVFGVVVMVRWSR